MAVKTDKKSKQASKPSKKDAKVAVSSDTSDSDVSELISCLCLSKEPNIRTHRDALVFPPL